MARMSDDELARIKREISLESLCRSHGIGLKKHGSRDLIGACPFHDDEEPSFIVTPEKNLFHCMGCGAAGSNIDLVMKIEGCTFREAVDKLIVQSGLAAPAAGLPKPPAPPRAVPEARAQRLLDRLISVYEKNLQEAAEAKKYLEHRHLTDEGLFGKHRVGYSTGKLNEILPENGGVRDDLQALGALSKTNQEHFYGCLVVPVFDAEGNIVTLYGRYTNLPAPSRRSGGQAGDGLSAGGRSASGGKRHVFLPRRPTGLWNVAIVKTYSDIILVESVLDALSVEVAGHPNVVAVQGTNGLNDKAVALFNEHGVRNVTLLLDGDPAGRKAAKRLKEKMSFCFSCEIRTLPDDHDPNSFLMEQGAEALNRFLCGQEAESAAVPQRAEEPAAQPSCSTDARSVDPAANGPAAGGGGPAVGGASFAVTYGLRRYEIRGLEKGPRKLRATVRVENNGKLHVDTLDFYSARSRRILAQDLCRVLEETPDTIEADLNRIILACERAEIAPANDNRPQAVVVTDADRRQALAFGKAPDLIDRILADFETCGLVGEQSNKLLAYLAMSSRKMPEPLSVLILSSSGAGKTALQDTALSFCPPEELVKLTSLSGKALFYKDEASLKHKVLALEEGDGAEEASYAIRNLISAGELVIEATIKDLNTGRLTTMENRVEGPTSVFITTTNPDTDPETRSRFFITGIDESRAQTRAILAFQRTRQMLEGLEGSHEADAILARHRNFQRLLRPLPVVNPFAGQLTYGDDRLQGRRDQPKYLNLIKAVAFLRQMQKPAQSVGLNGNSMEYIEADTTDIRIANELAHEILGRSLDELSRPGRMLLLLLDDMAEAQITRLKEKDPERRTRRTDLSFSRRDVREFTGWTNYRVHTHIKELVDLEYVLVESGRNGMPFRYRLAYEGQGKDGSRFLLGLRNVGELARNA